MFRMRFFKKIRLNRKGGPILEEILLIGIAVIIFVIIMGVIMGLIDWTSLSIQDFFGK